MGLTINQDLFEVDLFGGFKGKKLINADPLLFHQSIIV